MIPAQRSRFESLAIEWGAALGLARVAGDFLLNLIAYNLVRIT